MERYVIQVWKKGCLDLAEPDMELEDHGKPNFQETVKRAEKIAQAGYLEPIADGWIFVRAQDIGKIKIKIVED